jgi:eukaryotic-like serine/threonine-protein kinase
MPLTIGTQLGCHEITALLGKGGMGEVYRARDTKLKREVAIKILPDEFSRDPDRVSRFQREAELLASLNHPNIAMIYDVQEAAGSRFLVLELVEGDTLSERLAQGLTPVNEALRIAKNICEALEAAHERGVIHRDLKPGNIKITPDGKVKVLDFGLAKALDSAPANGTTSNSPTLTLAGTNAGVILGTAAYMSPEQARGRPAERRSDVFSFGCVLYEMLTGRQAFQGEEVSDVLASVLKTEPDFSILPTKLHPRVHETLRRCLQKNPKLRWQAMGDVRIEIEAVLASPQGATVVEEQGTVSNKPFWRRALPIGAAVVLSAAISSVVVWNFKPTAALQVTRFAVPLGDGQQFTNFGAPELIISPDGTQLVYEANRQLYQRSMAETDARAIPGTQATQSNIATPLLSPDGRYVVYWSVGDTTLKKVTLTGGPAVTICQTNNIFGGSWDETGIVFANRTGIMRVNANGGKPETLIPIKEDETAYGPHLMPNRDAVLFAVAKGQGSAWDNAQIVVQSLKTGNRKVLVERGTDAHYVSTGHIVYVVGGTLFAAPFDARRLEVTGGQVPLVEGIRATTFQFGGAYQFSLSQTGTLVYVLGPRSGSGIGVQQLLAMLDRKGNVESLKLPARPYGYPRISPDGKRVAFEGDNGKDAHIWVYELNGTVAPRQLTVGGANHFPVWSADGEWIAYQSDREGDFGIFQQRADGTGTAERLTKADAGTAHVPDSWSHDGQYLSFSGIKGNEAAVWIYSAKEKKATVFAQTGASFVARSTFSPDGHWMSYQSNEMGRNQIWVQPFPATGSKYPIGDGVQPTWSRDGKELFYNRAGAVFSVNVTTRPSFTFTNPMPLIRGLVMRGSTAGPSNWDSTPEGKQFIGVIDATQNQSGAVAAPQIQVVLHWFTELQQRVPVK